MRPCGADGAEGPAAFKAAELPSIAGRDGGRDPRGLGDDVDAGRPAAMMLGGRTGLREELVTTGFSQVTVLEDEFEVVVCELAFEPTAVASLSVRLTAPTDTFPTIVVEESLTPESESVLCEA